MVRSGSSAGAVSVLLNVGVGGTARFGTDFDIELPLGVVQIADGDLSASVKVTALDDSNVEGTEYATLSLSSATGATLGTANNLTLEITETTAMSDADVSMIVLQQLAGMGVDLSIDDFGTGYASLKYLKMLPVDGLKIDRLFVKDLPDSPADEAIIAAVVSLARASGFKLVAEGVERLAELHDPRAEDPHYSGFDPHPYLGGGGGKRKQAKQ